MAIVNYLVEKINRFALRYNAATETHLHVVATLQGQRSMSPRIAEKKLEIERLCQEFEVERLDLFGSAARGAAHHDVDFTVRFSPSTPELHAARYFGLLAALEDLFECPIDLVEERALRNPYVIEAINASRVALYAACLT